MRELTTFVCDCGNEFESPMTPELGQTLAEGVHATDPSYVEAMRQAAALVCPACREGERSR